MELNFEEFNKSKEGSFFLVEGRERDIDIFGEQVQKNNGDINVKFIRGLRCQTPESLIQEFSAALQFPYYAMGDNWNGFDECINDLEAHGGNKYLLLITNFDAVLSESPRDLNIFLTILKDAIPNLAKRDRNNIPNQSPLTINIIFHCNPDIKEKCMDLLNKNGIKPVIREVKQFDAVQ